ncbi:MAG: nucleotide exchange factor GrpE [Porticoccaceae bacterium]
MTKEKNDLNEDLEDKAAEAGQESAPAEQESATAEDISPEAKLEELQAALDEARDQVLRTQAEMQNLRRRGERDVENAHKYALEKFVNELIPVVDNLERATTFIDHDNDVFKAVGEGVELTLKSLLDALTRNKVEQHNPLEQAFDAELHQAVTMAPHPDLPANTVTEVFQKGYTLSGRLVRPAMVVVSQGGGGDESKG